MKKIFLLLLIIVTASKVYGQKKGLVYYGHIESPKMKCACGPEYNAYMVFDKKESHYVYAKDSLDQDTNFKSIYKTETTGQIHGFLGNLTSQFGKQVYHNRVKDSIYWRKWKDYYVAEKAPKIEWIMEKETKKIGSFTAYKATGKFRGRIYTAWYILEIPLPYGPWKLQGLPGLIIEAHDEYNEMHIYFKSLEYPTNNKTPITQVQRPDDHPKKWLTLEDYKIKVTKKIEQWNNNDRVMSEKHGMPSDKKTGSWLYIESF